MSELGPVTLEGERIRLEPLRLHHAPALLEAARPQEIWTWFLSDLRTEEAMDRYIKAALAAEERREEFAFAVIWKETGRVLGSTRYMDIQESSRGVEVGNTWYAPDVWGTVVNPACKFLLFRHAFDGWKAIRMVLKTDIKNLHSQRNIRKLGAQFEGVLRNHRIRRDRTIRDTIVFSITDAEWPSVRDALLLRIG